MDQLPSDTPERERERVHVYPLFGREHEMSPECWCEPEPDPFFPHLLIHNAEQ